MVLPVSGSAADKLTLFFVFGAVDLALRKALIKNVLRGAAAPVVTGPLHNPHDDGDNAPQASSATNGPANMTHTSS